jgi:hypothetical protein
LRIALIFSLMVSPAVWAQQPTLVGLPELKPLSAPVKEVRIQAEPLAEQAPASRRLALLDLATGPRIETGLAQRVGVRLAAALKAAGPFSELVAPGLIGAELSLEDQQRLSDCSSPSCLIELGALLSVNAIITPRLTLEQDGFRLSLDYMDLGVEAHWRRELRGKPSETELFNGLPVLAASLWSGKPVKTVLAGPTSDKDKHPKDKAGAQIELMRWGSVLVGMGGVAAFGSSFLVMRSAQEGYQSTTATANDVDQLASAELRARVLWGAGLALTGAGVAGFSLLGK